MLQFPPPSGPTDSPPFKMKGGQMSNAPSSMLPQLCAGAVNPAKHEVGRSAVSAVIEGTVKWFNNTRGYGFIGRENGPAVFVHYTGIVGEGYKTLNEGDTVAFEIVQGRKGPQAGNVIQHTLARH